MSSHDTESGQTPAERAGRPYALMYPAPWFTPGEVEAYWATRPAAAREDYDRTGRDHSAGNTGPAVAEQDDPATEAYWQLRGSSQEIDAARRGDPAFTHHPDYHPPRDDLDLDRDGLTRATEALDDLDRDDAEAEQLDRTDTTAEPAADLDDGLGR